MIAHLLSSLLIGNCLDDNVELFKELKNYSGNIWCIAFSPDGKTFVTGSDHYTAYLWSIPTETIIKEFKGHPTGRLGRLFDGITSVAFSPCGKMILTGSNNSAYLWDIESGNQLMQFTDCSDYASFVAFEPEGIITRSDDGPACLWDATSGKQIKKLKKYPYTEKGVTFSSDKKLLLNLDNEYGIHKREAYLRETETGQHVSTFKGHSGNIRAFELSPNGKT
ncbi:PD40 domain-containing protein, partial [Candidatus Dependentiae bacterium]|nr:PD40 domain-containing protein [Candidatus Dependentiae bacterium]